MQSDNTVSETTDEVLAGFDDFFADAEPRLRRALIARHGMDRGREATIDALTYGWRHWDRVRVMDNPVGYLYRIGANSVRVDPVVVPLRGHEIASETIPWVEPGLARGLERLTEHQRVSVVLRHSFDWTYDEIADVLEISVSSVRNHLRRGLDKLRDTLEVSDHD